MPVCFQVLQNYAPDLGVRAGNLCQDIASVAVLPLMVPAATAQLFLQRLLNCSCSDCSLVPAETAQLLLQQLLMQHMPESERALPHMSPDLYSIYEEGLATVGKPEHRETIKDMQQVFMTVIADSPQVNTNVQPMYDPVGNWSLDYAP